MPKGSYIGVNGVARKKKKIYVGVDGVAREVKQGYIGVDNIARSFFKAGGNILTVAVAGIVSGTENVMHCYLYDIDLSKPPEASLSYSKHITQVYPALGLGGGGGLFYAFDGALVNGYFSSGSEYTLNVYDWETAEKIKTSVQACKDDSFYNVWWHPAWYENGKEYITKTTASGMAWNSAHMFRFGFDDENKEIIIPSVGFDTYLDNESSSWTAFNYTGLNSYAGTWRNSNNKTLTFKMLDNSADNFNKTGNKNMSIEAMHSFADVFATNYSSNIIYLSKIDRAAKTFTITNTNIRALSTAKSYIVPYYNKEDHNQHFLIPISGDANSGTYQLYSALTGGLVKTISGVPIPVTAGVVAVWQDAKENCQYVYYINNAEVSGSSNGASINIVKMHTDGRDNPLIWKTVLNFDQQMYMFHCLKPVYR